jgi:hypothetical protein
MPRDPLRLYSGAITKFHMLYVVVASYLVCESCASVSHPLGPQKYAALPLAVPEWPFDKGCASLDKGGEQIIIRLCLVCRRNHFKIYPESTPSGIEGNYLSKQDVKDCYHLGIKIIKSIKDRCWSPNFPNWDPMQDKWSADQAGNVVYGI